MDNLDAIELMCARLLVVYQAPPKGWAAEALKILDGIPAEALDAAATQIMKTRKYSSFPSFAEILEAANGWIAQQRAEAIRQTPRAIDGQERNDERRERARTAMKTDMGQRAAREGWAWQLHDYVVNHGRMPDSGEQAILKRTATEQKASAQYLAKMGLLETYELAEAKHAKMAMEG